MSKEYDFSGLDDISPKESEYDFSGLEEKTTIDDAIDTAKGFGVGVGQGLTFGAGDEIAAGLKTAYEAPSLDLQSLLERYRANVKGIRADIKNIEESAPIASFAGNMVGGIVSPVNKIGALVKGASLGTNALQAAKLGAVAGFNSSEADLLQNPENVAMDTVTGAAIGGAIPVGIEAVKGASGMVSRGASALNNTARDKFEIYDNSMKALEYGKKGIETVGTKVGDDLAQMTRNEVTAPIVDAVSATRKSSGATLGMLRDEAAAMGYAVPMEANLDDMMKTISKITSEEDKAILMNRLKELVKSSSLDNKQLRSISEEMGYLEGKVGTEGQHAARQLQNKAKELSKKAIGEELSPLYDEANKTYATSSRIFDRMGDKILKNDLVDKETALAKLDSTFLNTEKSNSLVKKDKIDNLLKDLSELNPELGKQMGAKIKDLGTRQDLNIKSSKEAFSGLGGSLGSIGIRTGETAGLAANKVNKIISAGKNYISNNTPEAVRDLASKLANKGEIKYSSLLTTIAEKPERTRNALIFSLMQRSDFRQAISEGNDGTDK